MTDAQLQAPKHLPAAQSPQVARQCGKHITTHFGKEGTEAWPTKTRLLLIRLVLLWWDEQCVHDAGILCIQPAIKLSIIISFGQVCLEKDGPCLQLDYL